MDSYRSELREIIEQVYIADFGGRATQQMVHAGVLSALPDHLTDYLIGKGIASEVQSYFRVKGSEGLPRFPEVNAEHEHVQLEFLSVTEFAFLHSSYAARAEANTAQADKVRQMCLDRHGVDLTIAEAAS